MLAVAMALAIAPAALADQVENVNLVFQSGATFVGTLDFTSDYSQITGVSGTLTDYMSAPFTGLPPTWPPTYTNGYLNFQSGSSDYISWIWDPGINNASDSDDFGTTLMDGTSAADYLNFIYFTYNYSGAPALTLAPGDLLEYLGGLYPGVEINYDDPLVGGSITPTPEPSSLLLLGSGLVGFAGMLRRKLRA
jgi:hypothetical protein